MQPTISWSALHISLIYNILHSYAGGTCGGGGERAMRSARRDQHAENAFILAAKIDGCVLVVVRVACFVVVPTRPIKLTVQSEVNSSPTRFPSNLRPTTRDCVH